MSVRKGKIHEILELKLKLLDPFEFAALVSTNSQPYVVSEFADSSNLRIRREPLVSELADSSNTRIRREPLVSKLADSSNTRIRREPLVSKLADSSNTRIGNDPLDHEFAILFRPRIRNIIMSITKEQQQALDDALVPREQRLKIRSCNYRLSTTFKPKEPTFQIALDVLFITPFYQAFLITTSVPAIYMQEF
ncbi:hypothetical protein Tco_1332418 [Tanacetum coccineum]